jgi:general secretion pathway protein C
MTDGPASALLRHRHAGALATAALVAATVALLLSAGRMVLVALPASNPSLPEAPVVPVEQLVRQAEAGVASVASWHLFGNALPAADPRGVAAAPDTGLDLVLRGLLAADAPGDGRAIIADGNGNERGYVVGDEVAPGVVLDGVYPDRVTLSRGGAIEALRLPRPGAAATEGGPAAAIVPDRRPPAGNPMPAPGGVGSPSQPFVTPNVSTAGLDWNATTARLGVDAQQLAREISVLPVMEGGRFVGVRLQGGRDAKLVAQLGLEPGDVVTAVNGIELDSPARAAEVARSLAQATSASVTVRRDGTSRTLQVRLP